MTLLAWLVSVLLFFFCFSSYLSFVICCIFSCFNVSQDFVGLLTALHYECVSDDAEGLITVAKIELTDERYPLFHIYLLSLWLCFLVYFFSCCMFSMV